LGSTDGFAISASTIFGLSPETKYPLFVIITLVGLTAALAVNFYLKTTFGKLTTAIRDNEIRVEYLGFLGRSRNPPEIHHIDDFGWWCGCADGDVAWTG
jgi:branched-chain amino acid transport system permease protein